VLLLLFRHLFGFRFPSFDNGVIDGMEWIVSLRARCGASDRRIRWLPVSPQQSNKQRNERRGSGGCWIDHFAEGPNDDMIATLCFAGINCFASIVVTVRTMTMTTTCAGQKSRLVSVAHSHTAARSAPPAVPFLLQQQQQQQHQRHYDNYDVEKRVFPH
jgi:hypothetical protein